MADGDHLSTRLRSPTGLAAMLCTALLLASASAAHAQWVIDYTVRYEASGQQNGKAGERRGDRKSVV